MGKEQLIVFLFVAFVFSGIHKGLCQFQGDTSSFGVDSVTAVPEEESGTDEEESEAEAAAQNRILYEDLLKQAKDTLYDTSGVVQASSFDKASWEKHTQSFDFTEKPPPKKDPWKMAPFSLPRWNLNGLGVLFKYLALLLIIGAIMYIIARIMKTYWVEKEIQKEDLLSWEANPDKISYDKLNELYAGYLSEKNYTQALRVLFLMVLKDLSTLELIVWKRNKTNLQYLRELKNPNLQLPYRKLSNAFDAARYGNYSVSEFAFSQVKSHFEAIQAIIKPPANP